MRKNTLKALQVLISLCLLVFLLSKTDIKAILAIVGSANLLLLLAAFLVYTSTVFIASFRWHILLCVQKANISFKKLISLYFIGLFFNNFLPTSIGGDLYRAYGAAMRSRKKAVSVASVFTERLVGFLAITSMVFFSLIFIAPEMDGLYVLILSLLFFVLLFFLLVLFFNQRILFCFTRILAKIKLLRLGEKLVSFSESVSLYRLHPKALIKVFLISICYQLLFVFFSYLVNHALNLGLSIFDFILFVPVVGLISVFPISINGVGVREAGYVFLLSRVGRGSSEALSLSLMLYMVGIAASLIGGVLFAIQTVEDRRALRQLSVLQEQET